MSIEIVTLESPPEWSVRRRGGRQAKYPFAQLEVGQMFVLKAGTLTIGIESFRSQVSKAQQRLKRKFKCNIADNGDVQVYRSA
jgi:hypothetical protein